MVQNEKRQGENQPYGVTEQLITENTYPAGHPYSWTVIGSMDDLNAASLKDVQEWFKTYYGPSNAVLIASPATLTRTPRAKRSRSTSAIFPPGRPLPRNELWIAKMTGTHRQVVQDRVPQARVLQSLERPAVGLGGRRLPGPGERRAIARARLRGSTSGWSMTIRSPPRFVPSVDAHEIGGQFHIQATARPGGRSRQSGESRRRGTGAVAGGWPDPA